MKKNYKGRHQSMKHGGKVNSMSRVPKKKGDLAVLSNIRNASTLAGESAAHKAKSKSRGYKSGGKINTISNFSYGKGGKLKNATYLRKQSK